MRENYNYSQNPHISHIVTAGRTLLSEGSKIGLTETRSDQIWAQEEITLSEGISQPSIQFVKTNSPPSLPQRSYQTFSVERGRYWYCPNDPDWTGKLLFFHLVVNILQNSFLYKSTFTLLLSMPILQPKTAKTASNNSNIKFLPQ